MTMTREETLARSNSYADAIALLYDIVAASDSNNGESLMNCIESAREFLEQLPTD